MSALETMSRCWNASAESVLLATCDVQVEGAHFLRNSIPPRSLGKKALAINLSDIASVGGIPRFALVSLGLPGDLEVEFIDELYAGLREEGEKFGVEVVGGNISASRLECSLTCSSWERPCGTTSF